MRRHSLNLFLVALVVQAGGALASNVTVLHPFGAGGTGLGPMAPLISGPDGTLYGTASRGEGSSGGTVFKIQPDGSGFAVLKYFTNSVDPEGAGPVGRLVLSGNTLYGTASAGGTNNNGTVFRVNTDGSSFARLHQFTGSDGNSPLAGLVLSGGVLYGTTEYGGTNNAGTVFKLNTDGSGFTNLWQFNQTDGANPVADLLLVGSTLFGTTEYGSGQTYPGTLFKINTDGSGFTNFFVFPATGEDGTYPQGGLVVSGNTLYGTAFKGGDVADNGVGYGTVFQVNTDGSGFNLLHTFRYDNVYPYDGQNPVSDLVLSGNALYGITAGGGSVDQGTVFRVNTDSSGFTNLYDFPYTNGVSFGRPSGLELTNGTLYLTSGGTICTLGANGGGFQAFANIFQVTDGANPYAGLAVAGSTLFGTTQNGGPGGNGTVFRMNTDGTAYTNIYSFSGRDGAAPQASVIVDGSTLYGTTSAGGTNYRGNVFRVSSDGSDFTNLHNFSGADGAGPAGELLLAGGALYGTTALGGAANNGTVFRVNVDGSGFTNLYAFSAKVSGTNSDGANPNGGLVLSGGTFYGAAASGGADNYGTIFKLGTNGGNFAAIYDFNYPADPVSTLVLSGDTLFGADSGSGIARTAGSLFRLNTDGNDFTNLYAFQAGDGYGPFGGLILSGNKLYGVTERGGSRLDGTVFQMNLDGSGFTNLCVFTNFPGPGPANPYGRLVLAGNTLYGTTQNGGLFGEGVVFALPLSAVSPQLAIVLSGTNMNLSWSSAASGFLLQTNGDLATTNWGDYSGSLSTNGTLEDVSVKPSAGNLFFRLIKP